MTAMAEHREGHEYVVCPECKSEILLDGRAEHIDQQHWGDDIDARAAGEDVELEGCWLGFTCDWWPCGEDFTALVQPPSRGSQNSRWGVTIDQLRAQQAELIAFEVAAGEPLFMRLPDRWFERFTVRCVNGHVSRHVIKSEERGDMCPACLGPCVMTFPEDFDDP